MDISTFVPALHVVCMAGIIAGMVMLLLGLMTSGKPTCGSVILFVGGVGLICASGIIILASTQALVNLVVQSCRG